MRIEGAIFDLDGTLLDSMRIWRTIGEEYLRARGIEPRGELSEIFKGMSLYQAARYYQAEYGLTDSAEAIVEGINERIARFYDEEATAKEGAAELLQELQKRGVKICVATATDRRPAEAALKRNGLLRHIGAILTCTEVGHGKDEPDIYEAALAFLGTRREGTWVFEDSLYAVRTAKLAGFPVVGVFDRYEAYADEIRRRADLYIASLREMDRYLDDPDGGEGSP